LIPEFVLLTILEFVLATNEQQEVWQLTTIKSSLQPVGMEAFGPVDFFGFSL